MLIAPYSIRLLSKKLELYPAVILPDGSSTARYNDTHIIYSKIEIVGIDAKTGAAKAINTDLFFDPIPSNRIYGFVNNSFGIDAVRRDTLRFRKDLLSPIYTYKKYSEVQSQDLIAWYKSKLVAQGFEDSEFTFQEEIITIDRLTSEIVDSSLSRIENYTLND